MKVFRGLDMERYWLGLAINQGIACLHLFIDCFHARDHNIAAGACKKERVPPEWNPAVSVASFGLRKSVPGTSGRRAWSCQNFALVERQVVHDDAERREVHFL